jgi:hypothetical protein
VLLASPGEHVTALRQVFAELLALEPNARHIAELLTSVDVHYPPPSGATPSHPAVGHFMPNLQRATDAGTVTVAQLMRPGGGLLLDLESATGGVGQAAEPWADRVRLVRGSCLDGSAPLRAALVRPDGYVAWATNDSRAADALPGLRAALGAWFGQPSAAQPSGALGRTE